MKVPTWMQWEQESDNIRITKKMAYAIGSVTGILCILGIGFGTWGIAQQVELSHLRQETTLQQEQMKLLQQKTEQLDKKMKALDALDGEIRQMIKGASTGTPAQGGSDGGKREASDSSSESEATMTPTQMSAALSRIDKKAQQRLASFYTLRSVLKDGAGANIQALQSINFMVGSGGVVNSSTPSIWPSKGVITSTFGSRVDPVYGGGAFHEGLDIADDFGTPVVATAAGVITFAGYTDGGYGNLVEIDHGNGIVTRYGHNSTLLVSEGMQVRQGQPIALMGSTGKSTGAHVHYEVRVNGNPVDPMVFLPISNE